MAPERPAGLQPRRSRRQLQLTSAPTRIPAPARDFWFNAFNQDTCYDKQTLTLVDRSALVGTGRWSTNSQKPCSSFGSAIRQRQPAKHAGAFDYNIVQPRIGATYTVNPEHGAARQLRQVQRAAQFGVRAVQRPRSRICPTRSTQFYSLGFTTPGHAVAPSISYNSDFSIEHHFHGNGHVVQADAVLAPDAEPGRKLLHQLHDRPHVGAQRRQSNVAPGFEFRIQQGRFQHATGSPGSSRSRTRTRR